MTDSRDSGRDDSLDFDRAAPSSSDSAQGAGDDSAPAVSCASCRRPITTAYFTVGESSVCAACKIRLAESLEPVRQPGLLAKAALFGFGAAIVGAIIYWAVMKFLNLEIGLVAILTGYMVGKAVRNGANGRGGRLLQLGAALLTYVSVAMAYFPFALESIRERGNESAAEAGVTKAPDETTPAPDALAPDGDKASSAVASDASDASGSPVSAGIALLAVAFFALSLPILVIVGSMPSGILSAAIIGFGILQAWQLTAAPQISISGPFRVGGTPPR